jgi:hypothetical protein
MTFRTGSALGFDSSAVAFNDSTAMAMSDAGSSFMVVFSL